eukprot:1147281-Pelagomonas_calceolata.AAC.1
MTVIHCKVMPPHLFPHRFQKRVRLASSVPDATLMLFWSSLTMPNPLLLHLLLRGHTICHQFMQLGLDHQRAIKLARKLHTHSVQYACKLVTTKRANGNKKYFSQPGPGAGCFQ